MNFVIKTIKCESSIPEVIGGIHKTPWGNCLISQSEGSLCGLTFYDKKQKDVWHTLMSLWPNAKIHYNESVTYPWALLAIKSLSETIREEKTLLFIGTAFQISVWNALLDLQSGKICTYQDIAIKIGHPAAVRAVGNAVGKNRISLLVPCHRVLHKDGGIGGYAWGIERKKLLLEYEQLSKAS